MLIGANASTIEHGKAGMSRPLGLASCVVALTISAASALPAAANRAAARSDALRIAATIRVAGTPLAIAAGFDAVWVTDNDHGTVVRIDPKSNRVAATIHVGDYPNAIATGAGAVWVVARGIPKAPNTDTVQRVDPATNRVTDTIRVVSGDFALESLAVTRTAVWVAIVQGSRSTGDPYFSRVARIDPIMRKRVALIDVSSVGDISDLAASGDRLWVAGFDDDHPAKGAVLRINATTNRTEGRVAFSFPRCITASPGGTWVSSIGHGSGTISRIDPALNRISWTARVGDDPCGIVAGGSSVWAANSYKTADTSSPPVNNKVFEVAGQTGKLRGSIATDPGAGGGPSCPPCAPGPGGITFGSGSVWVITDWWNSPTRRTITRIDVAHR